MSSKKRQTKSPQKQGELLLGPHSIIEALKARKRKLISIYTTKPLPRSWSRVERYLPKQVPNIQYVSQNILSSMSEGAKHSGIVAWFSPLPIRSKPFSPETHPIITVLDGVQDVQNLGAILRSAYCTGVNGIVIPQRNAAPLTGAAHRASAGLAEHLDIWRVSALPEAVSALQDAGYNIYLAVVNGGIDVTTMAFQRPTCLVIGSEEKGISPEVRKRGTLISLPQAEENISYNASVAAGILMFTAVHNK